MKFAGMLAEGTALLREDTLQAMLTPEPWELCNNAFSAIPILRGCGFGLGMRVLVHPEDSITGGAPGEFGWYGHAGSWFMCLRSRKLSAVFIAQRLPSVHAQTIPAFCRAVYEMQSRATQAPFSAASR